MLLQKIMDYARNNKLSDIHIHSNEPIAIRVHGQMQIQHNDFIKREEIHDFILSILDEEGRAKFHQQKDHDMALAHERGPGLRLSPDWLHTQRRLSDALTGAQATRA